MAGRDGDDSGKDRPEPMRMQSPRFTTTSCIVSVVAFVAMLLISITIGALGPSAYTTKETTNHNHLVCRTPACNVRWRGRLTHMSPLHQALTMNAVVENPFTEEPDGSSSGFPSELDFEFPLIFHVNLTGRTKNGDATTIDQSVQHTREVRCFGGHANCTAVPIFALTHVEFKEYDVSVLIEHPTAELERLGLHAEVRVRFYASFVNKRFTQFEAGFKYFFMTVSLLGAAVYTAVMLCAGKRGEQGTLSACGKMTSDQGWACALLWGLAFFDDPFFLAAVYTPGVTWPAINTLCTVTFLAMLLLYFLCQAHSIAVSGEGARPGGAEGGTAPGSVRRDAWFYLFKLVFVMGFWMLSLLLSMYVLYELEMDPSYSVEDDALLSRGYGRFVFGLSIALGVFYLLWLAMYFVIAFRQCAKLPPYMQLWLTLTLVTVLTVLSVYWVGGFFVTRERNAALTFISLHATVNAYVYLLALGALPGYDSGSIDWAVDSAVSEARAARRGRFRPGAEGEEGDAEVLGRAGGGGGYRDDVLVEIGGDEDDEEEDGEEDLEAGGSRGAAGAAGGERFGSEDRSRRGGRKGGRAGKARKSKGGGAASAAAEGIELAVDDEDDFDGDFELRDSAVDVELGPGGRRERTGSDDFAVEQDGDLEV